MGSMAAVTCVCVVGGNLVKKEVIDNTRLIALTCAVNLIVQLTLFLSQEISTRSQKKSLRKFPKDGLIDGDRFTLKCAVGDART